jgi:AraC family transcriptional regulator of adaptative response / DNA-3-methyladenine glycosylase II
MRVPGCVDGFEIAVRAILGQQVSVAAARTLAGRVVERFRAVEPAAEAGLDPAAGAANPSRFVDKARAHGGGDGSRLDGARDSDPSAIPVTGTPGNDLSPFPAAKTLAEGDFDGLGITGSRIASIRALATAVAKGEISLDRGVDRTETRARLLALPGIGPWTADYLALRAFGDPDAFPVGDLILRRQAVALGLPEKERELTEHAERWRPWRAYASLHLWASASDENSQNGAQQ